MAKSPRLKRVDVNGEPILSAQVADSGQVFLDITRLYFHDGWRIADMTYGRGVFWKYVDQSKYAVFRSDLAKMSGIQLQADGTRTPYANESMDVMIFDPPYMYVGGLLTLKSSINKGYRNKERGFAGVEQVDEMYFKFLEESKRVLRPGGLAICKHMTQVMASYVRPGPAIVYGWAMNNGFKLVDWMINVAKSTPTLRWTFQQHSRRNYSEWIILHWTGGD